MRKIGNTGFYLNEGRLPYHMWPEYYFYLNNKDRQVNLYKFANDAEALSAIDDSVLKIENMKGDMIWEIGMKRPPKVSDMKDWKDYVFFRNGSFYMVTYPNDEEAIKGAIANPGTTKVEAMSGRIVWSLQ